MSIIGFGKSQVIYFEIRAGNRVVHSNIIIVTHVEGMSHVITCSQQSSSYPCLKRYRGQEVHCERPCACGVCVMEENNLNVSPTTAL